VPQALLAAWLAFAPAPSFVPAECRTAGIVAGMDFLVTINRERAAQALAPLRLGGALCAVAAERARELAASGDLEPSLPAITETARGLSRRGYRAYGFHEQPILRRGDAGAILAAWRERDPAGFRDAVLGDVTDLGVGRAELEGTPLWVLLLALPSHTVFLRQAAALGDAAGLRAAVLAAINRERERAGVPPLRPHPALERAAQAHAEDLERRSYYDHHSPEGTTPRSRLLAQGYDARLAAENLAKGFFSADEVVARWMLSSGHRANILNPQLVDLGVGWALDADAETALWVADFAAGGPPP